jgi:hypothetical protein
MDDLGDLIGFLSDARLDVNTCTQLTAHLLSNQNLLERRL